MNDQKDRAASIRPELVCTSFPSFDGQGQEQRLASFDELEAYLRRGGFGWAPVAFREGWRAKRNVIEAWAVGLDFDGTADLETLRAKLRGLRALVHTTKSHTAEAPRYRAIVPLMRAVNADDYAATWEALNARCGGAADPKAKDASRLWFVPIEGAEFYRLEGAELVPVEAPPAPPRTRFEGGADGWRRPANVGAACKLLSVA